jgi:hypothetical protein
MANEPENLVLELLRGLRARMGELRAELKADINSLRADVASDLLAMQAKADAEHKATRDEVRRTSRRASPPGVRIPHQRHRPRHADQ